MKRFLITSQGFEGVAELYYSENSLAKIDLTGAKMSVEQIDYFKRAAPVNPDNMKEAFGKARLTIVEGEFEVNFNDFWVSYDKKINKKRAIALWDALSKPKQVKAYFGITAYNKFLKKVEWGREKADPETYLRNEYWENEYK